MRLPSKLAVYLLVSLGLAGALFVQAFSKDHVSVSLTLTKLTSSKLKNAILYNALFAIIFASVTSLIKFFFGEMREIERYDIIQWTKQKVLSFAFMMILLREDMFTSNLVIMLLGVLTWSIFHWLAMKRSEYLIMENQSNTKAQIKISILFGLLIVCDLLLAKFFYEKVMHSNVADVRDRYFFALLGFEILILFLKIGFPCVKYFVSIIELVTFSHFEKKATIFSILQFIFTIITLISELFLFMFIYKAFGTPLHLILEALETISNLVVTISKFYRSIKLIRKFNNLPDVTNEDIENIDSTCLICLHEIKEGKKIPCGHIFHLNCLKGWIQENANQFCPKCKQPINIDDMPEPGLDQVFDLLLGRPRNDTPATKVDKNAQNAQDHETIMKLYEVIYLMELTKNPEEVTKYSHQYVIKKIFSDIVMAQESGQNIMAAVEYGLPKAAVAHRSFEVEELAVKVKLATALVMSQCNGNPFFQATSGVQKGDKSIMKDFGKSEPVSKIHSSLLKAPVGEVNVLSAGMPKEEVQREQENKEDEKVPEEESEAVRRRRMLLEAAERRNAMINGNEEEQESKKDR